MKLSEVESVEFSRNGFMPHVKSPIIWGVKGCESWPLCYLTKPKSVTDDEWNEFLDNFTFKITRLTDEN